MTDFTALFIREGTSDAPLADIVESMFREHDVSVRITSPDFSLLEGRLSKDLPSRMRAGLKLMGANVDVIICHRDADNQGHDARRLEMVSALSTISAPSLLVPIIPVRMTEAWLLLDETAIRTVAGSPGGTNDLALPKKSEVERVADPKAVLKTSILRAAQVTGRRSARLNERFSSHRRQLLERLDCFGPVADLPSWKRMLAEIGVAASNLKTRS